MLFLGRVNFSRFVILLATWPLTRSMHGFRDFLWLWFARCLALPSPCSSAKSQRRDSRQWWTDKKIGFDSKIFHRPLQVCDSNFGNEFFTSSLAMSKTLLFFIHLVFNNFIFSFWTRLLPFSEKLNMASPMLISDWHLEGTHYTAIASAKFSVNSNYFKWEQVRSVINLKMENRPESENVIVKVFTFQVRASEQSKCCWRKSHFCMTVRAIGWNFNIGALSSPIFM